MDVIKLGMEYVKWNVFPWKNVFFQTKTQYSQVPYNVGMIFIELYDSRSNRKIFPKFPACERYLLVLMLAKILFCQVGKPIVSIDYLTGVKVGLIDMRCRPDGNFIWILHAKDHFSKFPWATH